LQQFNSVDRVTHRQHNGRMRQENDTEHSYNLAMTAWFLSPFFPELDANLVLRYALVHDLVEVHAGDTYIFADASQLGAKVEREAAAAKQLANEWTDFPDIHHLIEVYETKSTAEARFVYALDKIMPIMLIYIHNGYTWKKEGITLGQLHAVKAKQVALSPEVAPYYNQLYDLLVASPHLIPPGASR
jgi:putative hydrolase of HD superfamily